jgi:H+-translocating NAD(P) transhydrogenase subunit beta
MNVLLSEAQVDYDRLITDVDEANAMMPRADVAIVIGANDTVNPSAIEQPGSPLYGMPIIRADLAQRCIVMKRSMAAGFAGVENDLFYKDKTLMLFGDAKKSVNELIQEVKQV